MGPVFEGSLDAGVDSWIYYNPTGVSQSSFVETQFEAIPILWMLRGIEPRCLRNQLFQLYGPKAVSLTFAVGDHTLDDVTSGSMTDLATAGTVLGGGWRQFDWFKYYYATSTGWLSTCITNGFIRLPRVLIPFGYIAHRWVGWWITQKAYPWTWFHTGKG